MSSGCLFVQIKRGKIYLEWLPMALEGGLKALQQDLKELKNW